MEENKELIDPKTLDADSLRKYLDGKNLTQKQQKEFYKACHLEKAEKVSVPVFDADGNAIMYQVKDKDGNFKFKKDGSPMLRQKQEMKNKKDGKKTNPYSHLEAIKWVVEQFPEDFKKKDKKVYVPKDPFGDWA